MGFKKSPALAIRILLCVCITLPISQSMATGFAQPSKSDLDRQIEKLKNEVEYVGKQEAAQMKEYLALRAEREKADANLRSVNSKISSAETRQAQAQETAAAARAEFAEAQAKLDTAVEKKETASERRQKAILRLYQNSSSKDSEPSVLSVSPKERQDVVRRSILLENYNDQQASVVTDAIKEADNAIEEKLQHEDARLRAEEAEKVAADEAASLVTLKADAVKAQKVAKDKEKAEQAIINSLKAKKSSYTKQISQLVAESNALAKQIKKNQNPSIPVVPGRMIKPINSSITSPFGYRTHPIYGDSRLHAGVDLRGSTGTPIKAAKAGKVIVAKALSGYGNVIIIDHGGGISTLYAHMSAYAVSLGANVTQGQRIGYVGATGQVTGPHLHWEVRVNGAPVNPMSYV